MPTFKSGLPDLLVGHVSDFGGVRVAHKFCLRYGFN